MLFKDIKIQNGRENLILIDRITSRFDNKEEKSTESILEKIDEVTSDEIDVYKRQVIYSYRNNPNEL